jgi:hypothetical protein
MLEQDLEDQPADSSQQADACDDTHQAEVAQTHLDDFRFMTWLRSFCQHKQDQSADSRGKVSSAGGGPCEDEAGRSTGILAEMRALIPRYAKFKKVTRIMSSGWWLVTLVALAFQRKGVHGVGRVGVPTVQQLWSFDRYPQRFWVCQLKLLTNGC